MTDKMNAAGNDNVILDSSGATWLGMRVAAQPGLNDTIRAVFLEHGFTIKHGQTDLKPYVYEAVHALLSKLRAEGVQAGDVREAFNALSDLVNALRERHYGRMPEEVQQAYDRAWTIVFTAPTAALASAPVAGESREHIEQMAVNRYRPVPDGKFSYKVVAGDGTRSLYTGTKDSCLRVAAKLTEAFLDGAFVASDAAPQASEAVRWVVTDDMRAAVRFAPSSAHWSERLKEFFGPDAREGINALEKQLREARADLDRQKHASEAVRSAALLEKLEAWQAVCDRIVDQYGGVVAGVDFAALGRANRAAIENAAVRDWTAILPQPHTDMRYHGEFVRGWNQCLQQVHAALSAQPRAQKHPRTDGGGHE